VRPLKKYQLPTSARIAPRTALGAQEWDIIAEAKKITPACTKAWWKNHMCHGQNMGIYQQ